MAIVIENVVLPYSGLRIPSWRAPDRGLYGVVGPNGSGKSQFFSLLYGGLKVPTGTVSVTARVGCVMQHPEHQLTESSVAEELLWAFGGTKHTDPRWRRRVDQTVARWQLEPIWNQSPWTLSTGQKRRVVLAVYDLLDPEVLLMDEPTEGLDRFWRTNLKNWLISEKSARLILIISHDWTWLLSFIETGFWCERVLDSTAADLGRLWYCHNQPASSPLEELWRELLSRNAPVSFRGWIDSERALQQVVKLWNQVQHRQIP
ncbi:MAG: energy-coupling factor ABC transporter ATP-binding protein [Firmicutes bacterium]|uniref:ABC transporter domain-containing protein n=1 Tax=Sulfobacillus benefaciens TaxID=453960 RepID=A0A2T2X7S4_9FIRM|nr:energy-coupling factor ABC transporter ATP-binding protein [Bacillota bacterium]PSR30561.1 MAG: hypothetical protein C7B43_05645 [Sulfobacillus benefaciens]